MTPRYVGIGGNDSNSGLSWVLRKLTLSGAEATPVVAGDTVYIGPGTYRETLTVGVSGTNGNPITYIGDYLGANTDGVGGVVRLTGSANDVTLTRSTCIAISSKNYRTFQGILMDGPSAFVVNASGTTSNCIFQKCFFAGVSNNVDLNFAGTGTNNAAQNCFFLVPCTAQGGVRFTNGTPVDNAGHQVNNCIFIGGATGVGFDGVGGCTVKNCTFIGHGSAALRIVGALTNGQTETINNCTIQYSSVGMQAINSGEITEDYNNIVSCATARTNVSTGAHSLADLAMLDTRWFFNLVFRGAGPNSFLQLITPFDLASDSPLVNVAGTSPTTTDMRGTAIQGAQREWGALEMDSTLKTIGGLHKNRVEEMR